MHVACGIRVCSSTLFSNETREKKRKSKMYDSPVNAVEGFHIKVFNTLFYLRSMVLWLDLPVCFIAVESYYFLKYIFLKRNTNA